MVISLQYKIVSKTINDKELLLKKLNIFKYIQKFIKQ